MVGQLFHRIHRLVVKRTPAVTGKVEQNPGMHHQYILHFALFTERTKKIVLPTLHCEALSYINDPYHSQARVMSFFIVKCML